MAGAGPTTLHTNAAPIVEHPVPHHLGVGRCLPRRPGRAGNPGRARWGACHRDRQRPRLGATVFAAPVARSGAAAPRPDRGGRRIAGRASICHGGGPAHAVGVRRCLTRWLGRADNPLVGRWSRCRGDRRGGRYTSRGLPRRKVTGAAHRAPAPVGRASPAGSMRAAVRRCADRLGRPPCRGRALPDPPARRAGNGRAAWPDAHSAERHGREDDCRPGRRAGGVVRRRSASPRHRLRGPSPVARYLPRFGAADSLCRAQALPDPAAREGWA